MKRLNNSQPLAVAVQYSPLNTSMHIKAEGGLSTFQFYRQQSAEWSPDHTHSVEIDANGSQTDGPIRLIPTWSVIDPDGILDGSTLVPQVYWFVDGTQITSIDPTQDYYIDGSALYVRKNFTHTQGASVFCECRFTDPRDSSTFVLSDTITLSAVLQADEQWMINILCDRTRKHYPLSASTTLYTFEAEARLGSHDKTSNVAWFWDYSLDNGATWLSFTSDIPWYVSGMNTNILTIDADYVSQITVRARIGTPSSATSPTMPNEATASLAWRVPQLRPAVYCLGGDKVLPTTEAMSFGLIVHIPKHNDMTLAQQREWIMCDWALRKQGMTASPTRLNESDVEVSVPASQIRNVNGIKYVADPQCSMRGVYSFLVTSSGNYIQTSAGNYIMART